MLLFNPKSKKTKKRLVWVEGCRLRYTLVCRPKRMAKRVWIHGCILILTYNPKQKKKFVIEGCILILLHSLKQRARRVESKGAHSLNRKTYFSLFYVVFVFYNFLLSNMVVIIRTFIYFQPPFVNLYAPSPKTCNNIWHLFSTFLLLS